MDETKIIRNNFLGEIRSEARGKEGNYSTLHQPTQLARSNESNVFQAERNPKWRLYFTYKWPH